MRIIKPSVTLLSPIPSTEEIDLLKRIEECGRICYKSEDKITEDSCVKFVEGLIKRGHEAVLEHASLIYQVDTHTAERFVGSRDYLEESTGFDRFLRFTSEEGRHIVSGNIRAWRDFMHAYRMWAGFLPWFTQHIVQRYPVLFPEFRDASFEEYRRIKVSAVQLHPDELVTPLEKLVHCDRTVIYTCDRGVTHEIVRHRPASYCQESTRYCNYSGDKFGNEITVIEPCYLDESKHFLPYSAWADACQNAENQYFNMLKSGRSPQEARAVLPNSLKTELAMTTNLKEWRHFLKLRCAPGAHPQMREVACQLPERFHKEEPDLFEDVYAEVHGES